MKDAALQALLVDLMREISELRAGELAMKRIISELAHAGAISPQALEIIARFDDYRNAIAGDAHAALESQHPGLAAELDRGRDEPPGNGANDA